MQKSIYVSLISFFLLIAVFSGMMVFNHFKEANTQDELYDNLAQSVEQNETNPNTEAAADETQNGEITILPEYAELYQQNNDLIGWICIEDTKINYPVMQSVSNPDFYLKHGFDKGYTNYGCPYVGENGDVIKPSDNLIIYGHHMLVVGTPGSGKTTFSVSLLDRLWKDHKIPFLVIEPAKNEYRALVQSIPELQVFTPGKTLFLHLCLTHLCRLKTLS